MALISYTVPALVMNFSIVVHKVTVRHWAEGISVVIPVWIFTTWFFTLLCLRSWQTVRSALDPLLHLTAVKIKINRCIEEIPNQNSCCYSWFFKVHEGFYLPSYSPQQRICSFGIDTTGCSLLAILLVNTF